MEHEWVREAGGIALAAPWLTVRLWLPVWQRIALRKRGNTPVGDGGGWLGHAVVVVGVAVLAAAWVWWQGLVSRHEVAVPDHCQHMLG